MQYFHASKAQLNTLKKETRARTLQLFDGERGGEVPVHREKVPGYNQDVAGWDINALVAFMCIRKAHNSEVLLLR
jgi:hypothetical protein